MKNKKLSESRKALYCAERRRVLFGLEQRTRLRVVCCPRAKIVMRHLLRLKGYLVGRMSNEARVVAGTRRSLRMEEKGRRMGMEFVMDV